MSHLTPNTPAAAAKLLRTLTSTLPTASPILTPRETFITATAESSESLLTALISVLTPTTSPDTLSNALHTVFDISNTIPPCHLAPHWRSLCQRVITISKQCPQPRTLITLSSLLIASISLSSLGTEQRAVVATIAQKSLQHAQNTLSTYPTHSLCLIYSIIHAAPRELRSQAFEERLRALFKHRKSDVRTLVAKVFAALVTCIPAKQQQKLFSEHIEYINRQIIDTTSLLDAFIGSQYNGTMSENTAREVCDHLDGVFKLLRELLDLPICVPFPLAKVLKTLCNGIRERALDPYAMVENVKITHDDLLLIIPHVQRLCAQALADITQRVQKVALQMSIKDIGMVFEMRLSSVLLRSRDSNGLTCIAEREEVYETIGKFVTNLGTGFLSFVVPRFQELVEIDVRLHRKCLASENILTLNPDSNTRSGRKSRKRKRHNERRDASIEGLVLTKESVQSLVSVYGNETIHAVESTVNAAMDVIARIFDCRGILSNETVKHLQKLEETLLELLEEKRLSPGLLRAATSAALSGGSKRMIGEASPLLMPLARVSIVAALDSNLSSETRNIALMARSGCEAIIHPRGPPYVMESRMYPKMAGNDRLAIEKQASNKNSIRLLEKLKSEQNGSLSDRDDGEGILPDTKEPVTEQQEGAVSADAGEKSGKTITDRTPVNDLMEVEYVAEIQPLAGKAKENLSEKDRGKGNEITEVVSTKQSGAEGPPVEGNNLFNRETEYSKPMTDKAGVQEHQIGSTAAPRQLQEMGIECKNASPKRPSSIPAGTERTEATRLEDIRARREENKTPNDHQPVNSESPDTGDEINSEKEDQALIDSLVLEESDEE